MTDYATIFRSIEKTLFDYSTLKEELKRGLAFARNLEGRRFTDEEYFELLTDVTFASGFKAETMNMYRPGVRKHFPDITTSAKYNEDDIQRIQCSGDVIGNYKKLKACVNNAQTIQELAQEYGSLQAYIDSFAPFDQTENVVLLKEALDTRFSYLGPVTVFHLMTNIGLPVLKPDRVIMRLFRRLGLVETEEQIRRAVFEGRKMADATKEPIRYIDIVLVTYGQSSTSNWGIKRGICLKKNPQCSICGVKQYCQYYSKKGQ